MLSGMRGKGILKSGTKAVALATGFGALAYGMEKTKQGKDSLTRNGKENLDKSRHMQQASSGIPGLFGGTTQGFTNTV
ncbi:hypothetical protein [Spiroplasma endosymbiont of Cantharis rufa]|uniref:hypothetical protein n=1 Tax=Spiroplasma endosymbiont of Cantharis rufa TaxID=3066279 RepID=UPI0030D47D23